MRVKQFSIYLLTSLLFLLLLTGCNTDTTETKDESSLSVATFSGETEYPVTIEDVTGEITIEKMPERIVSLSPANTETVFALGAESRLVGRTEYGNYPPEAESVASVGSYSSPNVEEILSKTPDLIIGSDYVDDSIRKQLEATGATVLVFSPKTVKDVENYIVTLGQVLDRNDMASQLITDIQAEYDALIDNLGAVEEEKSVFIDLGNYYSVGPGSLLNDELELIQAKNIAGNADTAYPLLSVETIISDDPDVYISLFTKIDELKKVAGFDTIEAFKNDQVYYYDGLGNDADMIQRPGPRIIQGMEILARDIYPDAFK